MAASNHNDDSNNFNEDGLLDYAGVPEAGPSHQPSTSSAGGFHTKSMGLLHKRFPVCSEHGDYKTLFCIECAKAVCCQCIVVNHNGHSFDYYHTARRKGITTRNALSWGIEDALNDLTLGQHRIFKAQHLVEKKVEKTKKDIKDFMNKCHDALERREQDLLRRLKHVHTHKKTTLAQQEEDIYQQLSSLTKSYFRLHEDFPFEDPEQQADINAEALRQLTSSREIELTPATSDNVYFWRDFNAQFGMRHFLGHLETGEDLIPNLEEDTGYDSPEELDRDY